MKLELKHVIPYLDHGMKCIWGGTKPLIIKGYATLKGETRLRCFLSEQQHGETFITPRIDTVMLQLQPLSYFWKGVTGGYVMELLQCDLDSVHEIWSLYDGELKLEDVKLKTYNIMCKNHIDFNRLIEAGKAIDKNTLND